MLELDLAVADVSSTPWTVKTTLPCLSIMRDPVPVLSLTDLDAVATLFCVLSELPLPLVATVLRLNAIFVALGSIEMTLPEADAVTKLPTAALLLMLAARLEAMLSSMAVVSSGVYESTVIDNSRSSM